MRVIGRSCHNITLVTNFKEYIEKSNEYYIRLNTANKYPELNAKLDGESSWPNAPLSPPKRTGDYWSDDVLLQIKCYSEIVKELITIS